MDSLNNFFSFLKLNNSSSKLLNKNMFWNIFDTVFCISASGKINHLFKDEDKNIELAYIIEEKYRNNSNQTARFIKEAFKKNEKQIFQLFIKEKNEKWQIIAVPNKENENKTIVILFCLRIIEEENAYKLIINEIQKDVNILISNFRNESNQQDLELLQKQLNCLREKSHYIYENSEINSSKKTLSKYRFLIAEDNEFNRVIISKMIESWGGKSDLAINGKIAINLLKKNDYDLVLMDIQMPVMDGKETIKYIRNTMEGKKSKIPILVVSAFSMPDAVKEYYRIGANNFMAKPFEAEILLSKINKTLNISGTEKKKEENIQNSTNDKLYDLSEIKKMANGNTTFIEKMMKMFIKNNSDAINQIKNYQKEKNWQKVGSLAHKIKPAVSVMKLPIVSELKTIELLAKKEEKLDLVVQLINKVENVFNQVFEKLQEELENNSYL